MSRDSQFVKLENEGLVVNDDWYKAIDIDMIANLYEKLMKEKFPLLKLDYCDVLDVLKDEGRLPNLNSRLEYIAELGCNEINKDEVLDKIKSFIRVYTGYVKTNPIAQLDADQDILLYSLYRKYIPTGYIFYWE